MALLDDLAAFLTEEAAMTVSHAVLLVASDDGLPRMRVAKDVSRFALFRGPAGLFFCDLESVEERDFFSQLADGRVGVGDVRRLDPKTNIVIEGNWPSRKVKIEGEYYTVPRNFARPLAELLTAVPPKRRRR